MSGLELIGITKRHGRVETLRGIDLSVETGGFLVLLGPSGCGKSTLLNIIAGLAAPDAGDVRIDGRSVLRVHPKDRDIAMVFQSYALYPNLTVGENIAFPLRMRGMARGERDAAVARAAAALRIEPLLDRRPGQLSGGQRQRVAIGRAMVRSPKVFLFDEPLSNLDAQLRLEMRLELRRLHAALGATVVYVTHDQIEAMTLATRVAVMEAGRVVQVGAPDAVYARPATLGVARFIGAPPMNLIPATLRDGRADIAPGLSVPAPPGLPGTAVIVGVRPERLGTGAGPGVALSGIVEAVEPTGPATLVVLRLGAAAVIAVLPPEARPAPGTVLGLRVDPADLRWFAADTGVAIG